MDVAAARRAFGIRPRIRRRVDREPQPRPARARLPDLRRLLSGQPGQRLLHQAVIDPVMLSHPGPALVPVHQPGKRACQQPGERLLIDPPGG